MIFYTSIKYTTWIFGLISLFNSISVFVIIIIIIIIVMPLARISLTLSRHFSLLFIASGRSSGLHPVSSHSCCMYVLAGRPAFAWPHVGVHRCTSLMSSSLLLQQCPACLVHLAWIIFVMGGSVTFRPLVKQTTTRNLYITIYIYFLDWRLCEVGTVRRGIRIVRRWGLNFLMWGDEGRDNAHCVTTREVSWTAGSFFSILFCSIRRPYITFKVPRRDKDTPLRLCNLPDLRRLGCVTSAHLEWPVWSSSSGNNCHAVHRSLSSGASLK